MLSANTRAQWEPPQMVAWGICSLMENVESVAYTDPAAVFATEVQRGSTTSGGSTVLPGGDLSINRPAANAPIPARNPNSDALALLWVIRASTIEAPCDRPASMVATAAAGILNPSHRSSPLMRPPKGPRLPRERSRREARDGARTHSEELPAYEAASRTSSLV